MDISSHALGTVGGPTCIAKCLIGWLLRSLGRRGVDHELKTLFGCRKLRDVMLWVCSSNVLLHGAITFFLKFNCIVISRPLGFGGTRAID